MSLTTLPPELGAGRTRQKLRTRNALIAAARELLARGTAPTVEEAAAAAEISRTTAYRYFRSQTELLAAAHPETEQRSLLPARAPGDPAQRLSVVVRRYVQLVLDTEPQLRASLRLSLEPRVAPGSLPLRQGRAIGWLEDALAPLAGTLRPAELRRLVLALRTTIGVEALAWLTDVAGLSREDAARTMEWSAATLLRGALAEKPPPRARRAARR